jgi:hypothetical protein
MKITDIKSNSTLLDSKMILVSKINWSSNGYSQEFRYHFQKIDNTPDNYCDLFIVTDNLETRIKIMSLEFTYKSGHGYMYGPGYGPLKIEYKYDESFNYSFRQPQDNPLGINTLKVLFDHPEQYGSKL